MSKTNTFYRPKYPDSPFIHVADLVNRETGKTYRELNAEKQHQFPVGSLVEIVHDEENADYEEEDARDGVRLFVAHHYRDCDMTPLYALSADRYDTTAIIPGRANKGWVTGLPEVGLVEVKP